MLSGPPPPPRIPRAVLPWLLAAASCSPKAAPGPAGRGPGAVPVVTTPVVRRDVPLLLPAIGTVQPRATVTIRPQVGGQLAEIHFKEGDFVKQGDLLFSIDSRPFDIALSQAEAAQEQARAEAANADAQEKRYAELDRKGTVSTELVQQIHTSALTTKAKVLAAAAAVEDARLKLDYCRILSPLSGRAGRLLLDPGNIVVPLLTDLVVINEVRPAEISFTLAGRHLPALRQFSGAGELTVEATPEGGSASESGTVAFFDNTVQTATGTIEVRALFPNETQSLWPGQFVDVRLRLTETRQALTLPAQCLQTGQSGPFVYVIGPDLTAEMRPVKVDRIVETQALIAEGLTEGESVVVDGQSLLRPKAKVILSTPSGNPAAAAPPAPVPPP